jgi:hypothetical protein
MLVAFARYSRDQAFEVLRGTEPSSAPWPPGPSAVPCSGPLLGVVPNLVLIPILALIRRAVDQDGHWATSPMLRNEAIVITELW